MASSQSRTRASASAIAAALAVASVAFLLGVHAPGRFEGVQGGVQRGDRLVVEPPGGLEPLGYVVLGVGQGPEELALAVVPAAGAFPGGVHRDAGGAKRGGGADQAAERVRVESGAAGAAQCGGDSLGHLAEVGQLARPRE